MKEKKINEIATLSIREAALRMLVAISINEIKKISKLKKSTKEILNDLYINSVST